MVCVNLVDRTEPTTITDLAENNNVPIIFFNRELVAEDLERWKDLYYVVRMLRNQGHWKENWQQMHLKRMQLWIKTVMVSVSM